VKASVACLEGATEARKLGFASAAGLYFRVILGESMQKYDPPHPLQLLRARRERPRGCRTAEQRDKRAPGAHSITSSARASTVAGMSMPVVLAVLKFVTSS